MPIRVTTFILYKEFLLISFSLLSSHNVDEFRFFRASLERVASQFREGSFIEFGFA